LHCGEDPAGGFAVTGHNNLAPDALDDDDDDDDDR
jgi:hypothetical protein